ncbi:radical SAM/SPASM domain-containing protein [Helicobacter trogontum]|uniref:Radical SAM/SPASM domain-containing protein n=2 Tax=Helicobacter trogontum TaxID=50960 RepID=A0A4U8TEC2_9HELI|nr:radical SAM/SPASM domain-containing protein [Helicobacter trogontum]MDY5186207.1 SPASM domain-containing protein [Helicobacter trogontum]TLD98253.1 radical SAM/SPASM domain-containing protein [Helicobacter trogontum]
MKFHKIYVEITDICKLSCSFCTPKKAVRGIMPLPLYEKIISQITQHTRFISLHVLGDPLCVNNLSAYIDIGAYYNVRFDIVSSAAFLKEEHFSLLTQPHIRQVSFSLDALFDNKHLQKDINTYFDTILTFYNYAKIKSPNLYINLRLFGNYDYTYFLQKFPYAILQPQKRRFRLEKNFFLRFHQAFKWHTQQKTPKVENTTTWQTYPNTPYCLGTIRQLAILANGIVIPCCIDAHAQMPLGDFNVQNFLEILYSKKMKDMQESLRTHKNLPQLCQNCSFRGV